LTINKITIKRTEKFNPNVFAVMLRNINTNIFVSLMQTLRRYEISVERRLLVVGLASGSQAFRAVICNLNSLVGEINL
jgi:hypothetical protein